MAFCINPPVVLPMESACRIAELTELPTGPSSRNRNEGMGKAGSAGGIGRVAGVALTNWISEPAAAAGVWLMN